MYTREEAKQLRLDFWKVFGDYSKTLDYLKPNRGRWILYYTRIKHLELKFEVLRHTIRVMIEVNHKDENKRLDLFEQLQQYKKIIESAYGGELTWDFFYATPSGNEVCRIYCENHDFDFHNKNHWPQMHQYMAKEMMQIELAFKEVKDFLQSPE